MEEQEEEEIRRGRGSKRRMKKKKRRCMKRGRKRTRGQVTQWATGRHWLGVLHI